MFLEFSIHCKASKNSLQIRFLVAKITELYKDFIYYIITLKLNVHNKLEISFRKWFLDFGEKGKVFI